VGQQYRFNPETGYSDHQEPSKAQLRVMERIAECGTLSVSYIGGFTSYAACIAHDWAIEISENVLALTDAGRAELQHQVDRAEFAIATGLPNTPRLAKFMYEQ
jgi:hypothetical protein